MNNGNNNPLDRSGSLPDLQNTQQQMDALRIKEEQKKRDMGYATTAPSPGGFANPFPPKGPGG